MKQETEDRIREALLGLDKATDVQELSVFAIVMPHGKRGKMNVQILHKGREALLTQKLFECMYHSERLPVDIRNVIVTAAAKWIGSQPTEAKEAFNRTVELCRKDWQKVKELQYFIENCKEYIETI